MEASLSVEDIGSGRRGQGDNCVPKLQLGNEGKGEKGVSHLLLEPALRTGICSLALKETPDRFHRFALFEPVVPTAQGVKNGQP